MRLSKIELWIFTGAYLFFILYQVTGNLLWTQDYDWISPWDSIREKFLFQHSSFMLLPKLITATSLWGLTCHLQYRVFPKLWSQVRPLWFAIELAAGFVVLSLLLLLMGKWMFGSINDLFPLRLKSALQLVLAYSLFFYVAQFLYFLAKQLLKWVGQELGKRNLVSQQKYEWLLAAILLWAEMAWILVLISGRRLEGPVPALLGTVLVWGYMVGWHQEKWLPRLQEKRRYRRLLLQIALVTILVEIPFLVLVTSLFHRYDSEYFAVYFFIYLTILLVILLPISKWWYFRDADRRKAFQKMENVASSSVARLDFLRSQINPHFLFNALNTLYGSALREGAEKTAEGVQKLGDMMRFMLKENQHEKIPLSSEVSYLQHYIDLQKLRTETSPSIDISFTVEEDRYGHSLPPMLLVPFVENAFKHGISLNEPSWIRISLNGDEEHLYFDVYNSIHQRSEPEQDPERYSSGIGLENVKQRLSILYPNSHELSIRKTNTEYFVHLTLFGKPNEQ